MCKRAKKYFTLVYSNIQGFTGKRDSIQEIRKTVDCDICLLTETMTVNVKMDGMKCITSKKSVGQNVAIVLRNQCAGLVPMRLYELNDVINMIGIRIETAKNRYQRFFTAHMIQMSTNDRESISNLFEEIKLQFHLADTCRECQLCVMQMFM